MVKHDIETIKGNKLFYRGHQVYAPPGVHAAVIETMKTQAEKGARVMELGAGSGAFTLRLIEQGYQVTASGIEPEDFTLGEVPFCLIDLNKEELPGEHLQRYDVVVAMEVIEHLENSFNFFRKVYDLLQPQGLAMITTPNISSIFSRLLFWHSGIFSLFSPDLAPAWGHIQILPSWLLKFGAEKAGLECEKISGVGSLREDLMPFWKKAVTWTARQLKSLFDRERFPGEYSGANILMVLRKG